MPEEVLSGEVVDAPEQEGQAQKEEEPEVPGELVARPSAGQVIQPLDLEATRQAMQTYQEGLRSLLTEDDYQDAGGGRKFVKKSGWRKIATWFGLSVELVRDTVDRDDDGQVTRATVWARAVAPNGRSFDGDGHCDVQESRFSGPRGNKSKLENDLRATAATRAMNRAVSGLVGMGAVSAEEMEGTTITEKAEPDATDEEKTLLSNALLFLYSSTDPANRDECARTAFRLVKEAHESGRLKGVAARAVLGTIRVFRDMDRDDKEDTDGSGDKDAPSAADEGAAGEEGKGSD